MFTPDTLAKFKAIAPYLSLQELDEYVDAGVLRSVVINTYNHLILGSNFSGQAAVGRVYVFGPEDKEENIIAFRHNWERIDNIDPQNVYQVAGYGMQLEPRIPIALMSQNDGVMPPILEPVIPTPPVVEIPDESGSGDESTETDPETNENSPA